MLRKVCLLFAVLIMSPSFVIAETIDVHIKGVDDGVKTTKQQDYKEAVLFAKREAIERAGVKVMSLTTAKDFIVHSDYIESQAEAVLLPGYNVIDIGYQQDSTYLVILIGKVQTASERIESKELRYTKSLIERGEKSKAKEIINNIITNSKESDVAAEAIYLQVLWRLSPNDIESFERLKAYYPNSKYVNRLKTLLDELPSMIVGRDGQFSVYGNDTVMDTSTGLMWAPKDNGQDINWSDAKRYCEDYRGGGYLDWRMPTRDELASLYDGSKSYQTTQGSDIVHLTEWIELSSCCLWASDTNNGYGGMFAFTDKGAKYWNGQIYSSSNRVLPVRSGK